MLKPLSYAQRPVAGFWFVGATLALGASLCLYQIGVESLWLDEVAGSQQPAHNH